MPPRLCPTICDPAAAPGRHRLEPRLQLLKRATCSRRSRGCGTGRCGDPARTISVRGRGRQVAVVTRGAHGASELTVRVSVAPVAHAGGRRRPAVGPGDRRPGGAAAAYRSGERGRARAGAPPRRRGDLRAPRCRSAMVVDGTVAPHFTRIAAVVCRNARVLKLVATPTYGDGDRARPRAFATLVAGVELVLPHATATRRRAAAAGDGARRAADWWDPELLRRSWPRAAST